MSIVIPKTQINELKIYEEYNCPMRNGKALPSPERDIAHDQWDKIFGIVPLKFEVYVLLDGTRPGYYIFGPFEFNHEPFYVGQGERGKRHIDSMGHGRQQDKFTEKVERIDNIRCIGGPYSIRFQIINTFYTQEKAVMVEKKIIRLIGKRYLTNSQYSLVKEPLLDEDYTNNEPALLM